MRRCVVCVFMCGTKKGVGGGLRVQNAFFRKQFSFDALAALVAFARRSHLAARNINISARRWDCLQYTPNSASEAEFKVTVNCFLSFVYVRVQWRRANRPFFVPHYYYCSDAKNPREFKFLFTFIHFKIIKDFLY